jgi:hypothetical protein
MKNIEKKKTEVTPVEKISRKKAIKKAGCYALTAASMILLLGTQKSAAASPPPPASPPVW